MARTDGVWEIQMPGNYIQPIGVDGYDLLIFGLSKYVNFNSVVGVNGYGFRDNAGIMEFKNNAGGWSAFGTGSGTVTSISTTGPITGGPITSTGTIGITQATTSTDGYLSSTDRNTFNSKESALTFSTGLTRTVNTVTVNTSQNITKLSNLTTDGFVKTSLGNGTLIIDTSTYLTTISGISAGGELTGTYPNPTLVNSAVIGKVLTGYVSGAGTVASTDSILQAIQKLNGNIGALVVGVSSVSEVTDRTLVTPTVGDVVVDISPNYVGQTSITTLGTITTGVWNGTAIANADLANSSITIGSTTISLGGTATTIVGLTSVTSTTFVGALTGNASTATALATGRTISVTGDLAYTSGSFNGTGNVTGTGTLATVNANVGTFGSATQVAQVTVNAKGLTTAVTEVTITPAASSITGGAALTKVDDTNITLTLGGSPTTALLAATSITVGRTGTLANARLTNSSLTIGSTNIALGATSTTLAGLTSVTSTSFVGALTGNADTVTVANETVDTTCFIGFYTAISGSLGGKTSTGMTYDSSTRVATFTQPIIASITGNAATVTTNANLTGAITSVGNATSLGSFSSANLLGALTDETGTGVAVFGTSPTFTTQIITPIAYGSASASGNLTIASTSDATKGFTYIGSTTTIAVDETKKFLGMGTTTPSAQFHQDGAISASAWTNTGIKIKQPAAILTDTSSSGTVAQCYINVFGGHSLAASNVTTYTTAVGNFYTAPVAGTNVTITNTLAAYYQGNTLFDGDITVGPNVSLARFYVTGNASRSTAWGVNGAGIRWASATYTDTTSSGTVTNMAVHGLAGMLVAATNVTTYTNAYGLYVAAPIASTNVTFTNNYTGYFVGRLAATTNLQIGVSPVDAKFTIGGNSTLSAWGTAGAVMRTVAGTYTDSSTAASGTAASAAMHSFGIHPIAATNATVTVTNAHTIYVAGAPSNGANVTITNPRSIYVNASRSRFTGITFAAGSATALTAPIILTTGTVNTTAEAGAFEYTTPQLFFTNGGAQRQEIPQIQQSRITTSVSITSNTTLANLTGLTATLVAGKHYTFEANFTTTSATAGGVKLAIAGTCTATHIRYSVTIQDSGGGITYGDIGTALATGIGASNVTKASVRVRGTITVNAAGTLTVQGAQNTSNVTASVFERGSDFMIQEIA